jgi:DNA modification methylase
MKYQLLQGDNRDTIKTLADNSIDAIVTDPPYGIDFLGKSWDANTGALETYQECLRVLKPGGHILAFSAPRTYHHLAVTLEQAGFEIRDQIMWIHSSGFPKAVDMGKAIQKRKGVVETKPLTANGPANGMARMTHNQSEPAKYAETKEATDIVLTDPEAKQWSGWKTALKPLHEPICMARKPLKGSCVDNVLKHGTGALNIDATRIDNITEKELTQVQRQNVKPTIDLGGARPGDVMSMYNEAGRYPSNVIGDIPDYQKYFYCPKVSRKERHIGFDTLPDPIANYSATEDLSNPLESHDINVMGKTPMCLDCNKTFNGTNNHSDCDPANKAFVEKRKPTIVGNSHPTVKPIELMKYLVKLITPPGGIVLDPFNGSGSTGCAAVELGHEYIGCELDPKYIDISIKRIEAWNKKDNTFNDLFTTEENK